MKITGTATLNADPERVWALMLDPAVLARSLPGCEALEATGPDRYRGTITAGVAAIKGTFQGEVRLTDLRRPSSLVLRASGAGAPGTVRADVAVELHEAGDGRTELRYDADAVVGGMVGGVGQRVLTGVAKKMAGEFFDRLDSELTGARAAAEASVPPVDDIGAAVPAVPAQRIPGAGTGAPAAPAVYPGRVPAAAAVPVSDFMRGTFFGAAIAFIGVLIGIRAGRRRRD